MYIKVVSSTDAVNLSNLLKNGDWMVLYYANWCGHCTTMKPEWQKVVDNIKKSNVVNIADVESSHISDLTHKPNVNGFPSIKMYNSGNEIANFDDERIADKIEDFAISNSNKSENKPNNAYIPFNSLLSKKRHPKIKLHTNKKSKTHSKKIHKTKKANAKNTNAKKANAKKANTKNVYNKLIKSFNRIDKEAKQDSKILKKAVKLL
jgi:thiol-disulfide isomerase/thioredoxin